MPKPGKKRNLKYHKQVADLYEQGNTMEEIGSTYGVSKAAIWQILQQHSDFENLKRKSKKARKVA